MAEWELTEEEMRNIPYLEEGYPGRFEAIARAQAKKVVEWLDGYCDTDGHGWFTPTYRWLCLDCRNELRRQVGLE